MKQIHPNVALVPLINRMIGTGVWVYHLYTNNLTLGPATVYSDFIEVSGVSGYAAITQSYTDFTLNGVTANKGYALAPPISWTLGSSGSTVYGFFVTDASTGLLACAAFDTPIVIGGGVVIPLIPSMGDSSLYIAS